MLWKISFFLARFVKFLLKITRTIRHIFPLRVIFPHDGRWPLARGRLERVKECWVLCCHVSPVPSGRYSTALCTDSVTQPDKEKPSGSPCPTHLHNRQLSPPSPNKRCIQKGGKLICRLGAVPVTTLCTHLPHAQTSTSECTCAHTHTHDNSVLV